MDPLIKSQLLYQLSYAPGSPRTYVSDGRRLAKHRPCVQDRFVENKAGDIALRLLLAALGFMTMFHPNRPVSATVAVALLVVIALGLWRHRVIAPPKETAEPIVPDGAVPSGDLAALAAEAKREV